MPKAENHKRLESLDILRGLDLFMLLFFQPVFMAFATRMESPALDPIVQQFTHVDWEGFATWDIIMPLFMFMAGVSMPFSLGKYIDGRGNKREALWRVAKRVVLLFLLGAIVQGNLLGLDPNCIYLYSNTLQAIASGYLITAMLYLFFKERGVLFGALALLIIYWLPMAIGGDYTPDGNFAEKVDVAILGRFRDGAYLNDEGIWCFSPHYHYTWIWSSLNFAVTVSLGFITGVIMRRSNAPLTAVKTMAILGTSLVAIALLLDPVAPIIKKIWSSTMTLYAGGICILLMALFYYIVDCKGWGKGLAWLKIYGMNSIAAYVIGEVVNFRCVADSLLHGLRQYTGDYYGALLTLANFLILFIILRMMYKAKIFIKV